MIQIASYSKAWKTRGVPRYYTAGTAKIMKETAGLMYAIFQQQKKETQRFLTKEGIYDWMYEDAQRQIAEEEAEKSQVKGEKGQLTIEKIKVPYKEIDRQLEGWWDAASKSRDKMVKKLQQQHKKAGNMAGQATLDVLVLEANFYLQDKRLLGKLATRGTKITGVISANTLKQFRQRLIKNFYYRGEDPRTVRKAIDGLFEETYKNRSWNIARTETGYSQNLITYETMVNNGVKRKRWLARTDGLTRNTHIQCAAQGPINIDQRFINGMMHPHEEGAPAGEVCNCRCRPGSVILPSDEKPTKAQIWHGQEADKIRRGVRRRARTTSRTAPRRPPPSK